MVTPPSYGTTQLRTGYVPHVRNGGPAWVGATVLVSALLAGCTTTVTGTATLASGGSGAPSTDNRTPAAPAPPGEADLQGTLVQRADLPADWAARTSPNVDERSMPGLAACLGGRDSSTDIDETGGTSAFVDAHADTLASTATSFLSQGDVDSDAALLRDPRAPDCFASALSDALRLVPHGSTLGAASFTVTPGNGGGPSNVMAVATGSVPLTNPGRPTVTIHVEYVFVAGRMAEAELAFISGDASLPADLRDNLVATVARRMAAL